MYHETKKRFSPRRESVVNRGQACRLAKSQPERAFALALTIPDGWYRCQAMSEIGRVAPDDLSEKAFRQARAAAAAGDDEYQRAAVLAFAITAAMDRGRGQLAEAMLADALALVPSVEPMASRAYALNLLWSTVWANGSADMRDSIIRSVQAYCHPDRSWRARRLYRDITDDLGEKRPDQAAAFFQAMPTGKARAYIARRIARGR